MSVDIDSKIYAWSRYC